MCVSIYIYVCVYMYIHLFMHLFALVFVQPIWCCPRLFAPRLMVVGVVRLHVVLRGDAASAAGDEALQTTQLLLERLLQMSGGQWKSVI